MRPAQEGREVGQGRWEYALVVFEVGQVDVGVAFAQLLSVRVDEEGDVAEAGRGPVEGVVQSDVHGG